MPDEIEYLSTNQLCLRYGGISKRTLLYWRESRGFPMPVFTARIALYAKKDVLAWEAENFNLTANQQNHECKSAA
ncbi:hypothetical protein JYB87_12030 [Shewanella avicenniae]|uniref:Transcriptional regulator, AlpA family n=1 Tax=Shewanella avicenniae TaxID=2814294 RepID=A0ABX7QMK5_9GAMM|nr:hypothetical protein [Shewanella avicenniae]QSX32494.1 hypothetical protein JYB87_12030 [Shewanella avicenniae]